MDNKKVHFDLDRLRAIPISRVAERWGCRLKKVGSRMVTNCPWHADEHPSLTLYETGKENGEPLPLLCLRQGRFGD